MKLPNACVAYENSRCLASGDTAAVVKQAKKRMDQNPEAAILIFDAATSERVEVDFRGTVAEVMNKLAQRMAPSAPEPEPAEPTEPRGPGRPKLGVVAREVTLLPRHWEWLNTQPGGASVALRKLVEKARHDYAGQDQMRLAQESCYRFISAMAGNEPGYEEATRALFAGDAARFEAMSKAWPADVREHARKLAAGAFRTPAGQEGRTS